MDFSFPGEQVTALAFAPDGRELAAGSWMGGSIAFFDLESRARTRTRAFRAHEMRVSGLAYAHDGQRLFSCSWDATLAAWSTSDGSELARVKQHSEAIRGCALSHDGSLLATCSAEGRLCLWDVRAGALAPLELFPDHGAPLFAVAFSPDDRRVASADNDGTIALWDIDGTDLAGVLRGHHRGVGSLSYSMRTGWLASCSADGSLRLWSGEPRASFALRGAVPEPRVLAWTGARTLLAGGGSALAAWDAAEGRQTAQAALAADVDALSVSPVVREVAVGLADGSLVTLDGSRLTALGSRVLAPIGVTALSHGGDGSWIVAGCADGSVRRVRTATPPPDAGPEPASGADGRPGGPEWTLRPLSSRIVGLAPDPSGEWIAVVGEEGTLAILDAADGAERARVYADRTLFAAARAPDGKLLAVACGDGSVLVRSLPDLESVAELGPASTLASALAWDADGRRLAVADATGAVCLWDVESRRALLYLEGGVDYGEALAFAPDSSALALASRRGGVRLWRAPPVAE
jgi:WD40 repeat protein